MYYPTTCSVGTTTTDTSLRQTVPINHFTESNCIAAKNVEFVSHLIYSGFTPNHSPSEKRDYWNRTSISTYIYTCHCAMLRMYPISSIQNNLLGSCASVCYGYHFRYLWCMEPVLVNEVANFACHVCYVASTYDVAKYIYRWPKHVISDMALEANENTFSNTYRADSISNIIELTNSFRLR